MRTLFILLSFVFAGYFAAAQKITKVYGYRHVGLPGNIPVVPKEGDDKAPPVIYDYTVSYYIYVESSQAKAPVINYADVQGTRYKVSVVKQQQPAVYEYFDGVKSREVQLVPKGRKNVYLVILNDPNGPVTRKSSANDLVICYTDGKKVKTASLKNLKDLPVRVVQ